MPPTTRVGATRVFSIIVLLALLAACTPINQPAQPAASLPTPVTPPDPTATALPPATLLERALSARAIGDYDAAAADLHALLQAHPQASEARPAQFYLAESFALRGRWTSAAAALPTLLNDATRDEWHARALFWLARCHEAAGSHADAVAAYERYRALATPLEPYARLRQAAQQVALGQAEAAAQNYQALADSDLPRGERAGSLEKAIALRLELGQPEQALQLYTRLLELAERPDYRGRILLEAAALAQGNGQAEQARAWLRQAASGPAEQAHTLAAVEQLLANPAAGLSPAQAAGVLAAHGRWEAALAQYDAAIPQAEGESALELRRQRALALRALANFDGALAELAAIAAAAPDGQPGRQAQLDWVQTRGQAGDPAAAVAGYLEFFSAYPADPRAPEALSRRVLLLEGLGDPAALDQQVGLGRSYPETKQGQAALEAAARRLDAAGRPAEARELWELLSRSATGTLAAEGAYQAARSAQQAGQLDAVDPLFEAALKLAPDSYYGARAAEELGRLTEGSQPLAASTSVAEWRAAETWLAGWSGQPTAEADSNGFPAAVVEAPPLRRAVALAEYGLQAEAIAEWNSLIEDWREDPTRLYLLARQASQAQQPYSALRATAVLLRRAPDTGADAPVALRRLLFPTPYAAVVEAQAQAFGLDPRALYALLRQESLFNPAAVSWAGAMGIAQVMPATGRGIAQNLKLSEFNEADLLRPMVGIRFGAYYLSRQIAMMQGSLPGGLAAYNGGPGNAQRWAGGTSVPNPDSFVAAIDYPETSEYVRLVYGYYRVYQRLYSAEHH